MNAQRIVAIFKKEFMHILRDWQTLVIVFLMPVIMMFLYGYALTTDLTDVPIAVADPANSSMSRAITQSLDASPLFAVTHVAASTAHIEELFRVCHVKAVVALPADLPYRLQTGAHATIQLVIDGSDPNTATILSNVIEAHLQTILLHVLRSGVTIPQIDIRSEVLYNPDQRSALFFIPGLMAVILMMISALLTSLTLTREKETGTINLLLVSPLRPAEIIIGKILPYCLLALGDGALILLVGYTVFGVACVGNYLFLGIASLLYIAVALALGLLISTIASNQQQAMMMVLPATMLPTMILSGFIFPLASLPMALQVISRCIPATYYIGIIRGIMLKGNGMFELYHQTIILLVMLVILLGVTIKRFRITL